MQINLGKAKELFLAALDMSAPERAAYLDTACAGDSALRQRIEAMLRTHANSGELFQRPAAEMLADANVTEPDVTCAFPPQPQEPGALVDHAKTDPESLSFLQPNDKPGCLGRLGHYAVQEVIGKGGFGIVLKAFDEKLHRIVAIKVLLPAYAASGSARKRFIREARAAAAVSHDHVVGIYAVEETQPPPYIVMQCVNGQSLQDKLDKHGTLGLKEILRIGLQTAEGLAAAHKQGLVHRDIKPANILLENGVERVKITDFGLARAVDDASVTQSGTVAGTPMYMSPEQAEGLPIDHRSDLFSLGTVLYAMCTGHPPFRASGTHAVLKRVIDASPRPIREINSEIPDWLVAIIAKLHAKKPEDRFQTAKEVADLLGQRLADVQAGRTIAPETPAAAASTRVPSRVPTLGRWYRASALAILAIHIVTYFQPAFVHRVAANNGAVFAADRYWTGWECFVEAWNANFLCWYANPALWAGMVFLALGRWRTALVLGVLSLTLALSNLVDYSMSQFHRGYGWWVGSMAMLAAASAIGWVRDREWRRADVQAGRAIEGRAEGREAAVEALVKELMNWPLTRPDSPRRRMASAVGLFALVAAGLAIGELTDMTHFFHSPYYLVNLGVDDPNIHICIVPAKDDNDVEQAYANRGPEKPLSMPQMKGKEDIRLLAGAYWFIAVRGGKMVYHQRVKVDRSRAVLIPVAEELAKKQANEPDQPGWVQLFNDQVLTGWGQVNNPVAACKFEERDGVLKLHVPSGDHDLSPLPGFNLSAPRIWRDVEGDFTIRVYVDDVAKIPAKAASEAGFAFAGGGLLVWQDGKNFLRLLRGYSPQSKTPFTVEKHWFQKGVLDGISGSPDAPYLQIERKGAKFFLRTSKDGQSWGDLTVANLKLASKVKVGVVALNTLDRDVTLRFAKLDPGFGRPAVPPLAFAPFDAKKAKEHQDAWAKHLGVKPEITNSIDMKLQLIPPGKFLMGSPTEEPGRQADETVHEVTLTRPVYLGAAHVTVGQFKAFVKAKAYKTNAQRTDMAYRALPNGEFKNDPAAKWDDTGMEQTDAHPVVCVSWIDAKAFCDWLSEEEGRQYTLPTEAEWEYAARAGTPTKFSFGDDDRELGQYAWYDANSQGTSHPVALKKPNPWGLFDMHGLVWQWTADWYAADYYKNSPRENPPGPATGPAWQGRVTRGGLWAHDSRDARSAQRHGQYPQWVRHPYIGFRVAVVDDLKAKTLPAE